MKVKNICKRTKLRIQNNNKSSWFVHRVIYKMCSKKVQQIYEQSKLIAKANS